MVNYSLLIRRKRKKYYLCNWKSMKKNSVMIKEGEKVKVDPRLTGLDEWIEGTVIDIEHNPFKGLVIAIRDKFNRIFFGEQKYFIPVNEDNVCMQ